MGRAKYSERGRFIANTQRYTCASCRRMPATPHYCYLVGLNLHPISFSVVLNPRIVRHSVGCAMRIYIVAKCFPMRLVDATRGLT